MATATGEPVMHARWPRIFSGAIM